MKTLYLDCKMGIAGDMLSAALLGLSDDKDKTLCELNNIGISGIEYKLQKVEKCGIVGNQMHVLINGIEECADEIHENIQDGYHEHSHELNHSHVHENSNEEGDEHEDHHKHHSMYEIEDIIESLNISKEIKSDVREIYSLLAEAEGNVHGKPIDKIHFHEVGDMDAVADIVAVCYLMHKVDPDKIIVSPINVGSGTVKCAHGILPVPAPATAYLLKGIPSYESTSIKSELCTPTGAALVKYFADEFDSQPVMSVKQIGYGMGKKDFHEANAIRAMLGETKDDYEQIVELSCNIDDMTSEEIGFAKEMLFEAGALEVYTTAADMKKNRPGHVLYCICRLDMRDEMLEKMFLHTTTLGIRENICNRYTLSREIRKEHTIYGDIRIKTASGYGVTRRKVEYDDVAGIAKRVGKSIIDLKREIEESIKEE